jgi:TrpR-related protein YerC/YecD
MEGDEGGHAAGRERGSPQEPDAVPGIDELADALLALRDRDECRRFLRDLCTLPELEALVHRWQIACLLDRQLPYLEVAQRVHASTTTVTRVAYWLRHGTGGYRIALERTGAGNEG